MLQSFLVTEAQSTSLYSKTEVDRLVAVFAQAISGQRFGRYVYPVIDVAKVTSLYTVALCSLYTFFSTFN